VLLTALHFKAFECCCFCFSDAQSQQDLSLDDIDDSCGTEGDRMKKGRFRKRLGSPDRSVWDISSYLPGGERKNEIEKMFEKFKIKMAADDEDVNQDVHHTKMDVKSVVTSGISDSDFSPAHNEHSKLIGRINKAYNTSVNDIECAVAGKGTEEGGEKVGKKKHKHKKDKHDKEKKSRHSKSKSKHAAEPDNAAIIPAGIQSTIPSSDDVFPTTFQQNSSDVHCLFSHSSASHMAESAELDLPSVLISCQVDDVFSETPGESNADDIGSVDMNPLDFSTSELLPEVCFFSLFLIQLIGSILFMFHYIYQQMCNHLL